MSFLSELTAKEIGLGVAVLLLLFLLANPFGVYMLSMAGMTILALLVATFLAFSALVWGELRAADEREAAHQALVGRTAYLAGAAVLLGAIVVQSLWHNLDIALVLALGVMVLAKIIGNAYVRAWY